MTIGSGLLVTTSTICFPRDEPPEEVFAAATREPLRYPGFDRFPCNRLYRGEIALHVTVGHDVLQENQFLAYGDIARGRRTSPT
jgi:hypothetical protein